METVNLIECQVCKCVTEVKTDGVQVFVPFNCSECGAHFVDQSEMAIKPDKMYE